MVGELRGLFSLGDKVNDKLQKRSGYLTTPAPLRLHSLHILACEQNELRKRQLHRRPWRVTSLQDHDRANDIMSLRFGPSLGCRVGSGIIFRYITSHVIDNLSLLPNTDKERHNKTYTRNTHHSTAWPIQSEPLTTVVNTLQEIRMSLLLGNHRDMSGP